MNRDTAIKIVNAYFDAFNRGDSAAMEALVAEPFEHHVNQGAVRHGVAAFAAFNRHMGECYRERLTDIVILASEDGTRAAAEFIVEGSYLKTDEGLPEAAGQRYTLPAGTFFTLSEAGINRVATHYNLQDWIRQVCGEDR